MNIYKISVSTSDKGVNAAIKDICGELITHEELTHDGFQRRYSIEEHDNDSFAHLMIQVGMQLQKISPR